MKVLWTHNFNPRSMNSGSFMHLLAAGMRRLGVQLDLHYLGALHHPSTLVRARMGMAELARGYDLVHAQFGSACALVTGGANGPKILSLRGSDWYRYRERLNAEALHSFAATAMSRSAIPKFDSIIVMSNRMRTDVLSYFPKATVEVLPDPIDILQFAPMERDKARSLLGVPFDKDRWVLFTTQSTDNPVKRVPLAVSAVELANSRFGNIKIKIATGLAHEQMPAFVSSCDVVLCTSVHEGWPNCIKEALACNLPFVSTDVSDLASVAAIEKSCHICIPDAQVLASGIAKSLEHPKTDLRRHVLEMDLELTSKKLYEIYERLLEK